MVYDWEAYKLEMDGKNSFLSKDYGTAIQKYETAGGYRLKLSQNSKDMGDQLKLLNYAIADYKNAHKIVLHYQSVKRGSSTKGSVKEISELREKGNDLSNKIRKMEGTRDLLESRQKRKSSLEGTFGVLSIISFVLAIIFVSSSLTGFVTLSFLSAYAPAAFSLVFFVLGIGFVLFYSHLKHKKK